MTRHTDAASSPQPQAGGDFLPAARLPNQIHRLSDGAHDTAPTARLSAQLPPDCLTASGGLFGAHYMGSDWQLEQIKRANQ